MVALSPGVDSARAAEWKKALQPVLLEGEEVRAFARSRSHLVRDGIAFTNARIFTFYSTATAGQRIVDWVGNDKIGKLTFAIKVLRSHGHLSTPDGGISLGAVAKAEVSFIQEQVAAAKKAGIGPEVSEAMELLELEMAIQKLEKQELLEGREKVPVVGDALKPAQWESIHTCARGNELPWLVLSNGGSGIIAAFEDRLVVIKGGMMSSVASGSITLGGSATFRYSDITSIQHIGKQMDGTIEIVTPTNPSLTMSLMDGQKLEDERWKRSNCVPMPRILYGTWSPHLDRIGERIAAARR